MNEYSSTSTTQLLCLVHKGVRGPSSSIGNEHGAILDSVKCRIHEKDETIGVSCSLRSLCLQLTTSGNEQRILEGGAVRRTCMHWQIALGPVNLRNHGSEQLRCCRGKHLLLHTTICMHCSPANIIALHSILHFIHCARTTGRPRHRHKPMHPVPCTGATKIDMSGSCRCKTDHGT